MIALVILMMLTGKNCVFLNSVQEFTEMEAWLFLTFSICLLNQLSSIHSIVMYERVQMFEIGYSSNRKKMNGCCFQSKV